MSERITYNEGDARVTSTTGAEAQAKMVREQRALKSASDQVRSDYSTTSQAGYVQPQFDSVDGEKRMSPYLRDIEHDRARYAKIRAMKRSLEPDRPRER